jgi:hypothetical protein
MKNWMKTSPKLENSPKRPISDENWRETVDLKSAKIGQIQAKSDQNGFKSAGFGPNQSSSRPSPGRVRGLSPNVLIRTRIRTESHREIVEFPFEIRSLPLKFTEKSWVSDETGPDHN